MKDYSHSNSSCIPPWEYIVNVRLKNMNASKYWQTTNLVKVLNWLKSIHSFIQFLTRICLFYWTWLEVQILASVISSPVRPDGFQDYKILVSIFLFYFLVTSFFSGFSFLPPKEFIFVMDDKTLQVKCLWKWCYTTIQKCGERKKEWCIKWIKSDSTIHTVMGKYIGSLGKYDQRRMWNLICIVNLFELVFKEFTFHWIIRI